MSGATIKVDFANIYKTTSPEGRLKGQRAMANQMWADMNQYVPMDTGDLRSVSSIALDGSKVIYNQKYAAPQFYGNNMRKYTTPGTGKRWDLKAKGLHLPAWKKAYIKGAGL